MPKGKTEYKSQYTASALEDLIRIDRKESERIRKKIRFFAAQKDPLSFAEPLKGLEKCYRWRIGRFRIIFRRDTNTQQLHILWILAIRKRDKAYKKLS